MADGRLTVILPSKSGGNHRVGQGTKFPDERGESSRFSDGLFSAVDLCKVKLRETIKMWPACLGPSLSGEDITHTAIGMTSLTWAFSPGPLLPPLTCGRGPSQFRAFWEVMRGALGSRQLGALAMPNLITCPPRPLSLTLGQKSILGDDLSPAPSLGPQSMQA